MLPSIVEAFASDVGAASSLLWSSPAAGALRQTRANSLVTALKTALPTEIAPLMAELMTSLQTPLLDGRPSQAAFFSACADAVVAVASKLHNDSLPLVDTLLPLLIDQAGLAGASSIIGAHAHGAVAAILPHVPSHDAAPAILRALSLASAPPAGRRRLTGLLLLALLTGAPPTGRLAPALALVLCRLLHDANATTRKFARHALLVLMESAPRAATEPFSHLPLRSQKQLSAVAKQRASALGPPLLPSPPNPPPHPQAALLQAAVRGVLARCRAAAAASFYAALAVGDRLVVGGHAGVLRYRGACGFAPGVWLGVELDAPVGKHDGAVQGHRFFRCPPRTGLFVRPTAARPFAAEATARKEWPRRQHAHALVSPPVAAPVAASVADDEPTGSEETAMLPLRAPIGFKPLLESHRGALTTMRTLCDGQLALLSMTRAVHLEQRDDSGRAAYLEHMDLLCQQQRLLAMQLGDAVRAELRAGSPRTVGDVTGGAESLVMCSNDLGTSEVLSAWSTEVLK